MPEDHNPGSNPERQADLNRIAEACRSLGEHFDNVQIFATRHMPSEHGGTIRFEFGVGNFYARYGQVHLWIERHRGIEFVPREEERE